MKTRIELGLTLMDITNLVNATRTAVDLHRSMLMHDDWDAQMSPAQRRAVIEYQTELELAYNTAMRAHRKLLRNIRRRRTK